MDIFIEIMKTIVSMGIVGFALQFVFNRRIATHRKNLNMEVENIRNENQTFRDRSKAAFGIEIERARASYSEIYKKRMNVIGECYEKLVSLHKAVHNYTKMIEMEQDGSKEERFKELINIGKDFMSYYLPNQLYLTSKLEELIDTLQKNQSSVTIEFYSSVHGREQERGAHKEWVRILEQIESNLDPALKELRAEMRKTLDPPNQFLD